MLRHQRLLVGDIKRRQIMGGIIDLRDNRREQAVNAGYENIFSGLNILAQQKDRERALNRQRMLDALIIAKMGAQATPEQQQAFSRGEKGEKIDDFVTTEPMFKEIAERARKTQDAKIQKDQRSAMLTSGQIKLDQSFAKDYNTFQSQGGFADAQKGIDQLEEVSSLLSKGDDLTGPFVGAMPMSIRKRILPDSASIQQTVEEVVQRNLRLILGAQFTEKEGTRLIERAFDPSLSETENKKRVDRLLNQMKTALYSKQRSGEYFEKHGTLKGLKGGKDSSINDFNIDESRDRILANTPASTQGMLNLRGNQEIPMEGRQLYHQSQISLEERKQQLQAEKEAILRGK